MWIEVDDEMYNFSYFRKVSKVYCEGNVWYIYAYFYKSYKDGLSKTYFRFGTKEKAEDALVEIKQALKRRGSHKFLE